MLTAVWEERIRVLTVDLDRALKIQAHDKIGRLAVWVDETGTPAVCSRLSTT